MTTPKDRAPGLIERLRDTSVWHQEKVTHTLRRYRVDRIEASTRIKQLDAENAELRGKLERVKPALIWAEPALRRYLNRLMLDDHDEAAEFAYQMVQDALTEQANIRSPVQSQMAKMVDPR